MTTSCKIHLSIIFYLLCMGSGVEKASGQESSSLAEISQAPPSAPLRGPIGSSDEKSKAPPASGANDMRLLVLKGKRLVIAPSEGTILPTDFGNLSVGPKAIVYLCSSYNGLAIFALDAKGKDEISIAVENKTVSIPVGTELVLTRDAKANFKDVNPKSGILYRKPMEEKAGNTRVFKAEFMIESAVHHIEDIRRMADSNDPAQKKILNRILKNAAILQSAARRQFNNTIRVASVCDLDARVVDSNVRAGLGGGTIGDAHHSGYLYGNVEDLELGGLKLIDLRTDQPKEILSMPEPDVFWLTEKKGDWMALDSRNERTDQTTALVSCSSDCFLNTELSKIRCKKGSTLFVDNQKNDLTICVFDCHGLHDVTVHLPTGHFLRLTPGSTLVLHKDSLRSHKARQAHLLYYRCWSLTNLGDLEVYRADCCLSTAMYRIAPLRAMLDSKNPDRRATAQGILKNAAILAHIDP